MLNGTATGSCGVLLLVDDERGHGIGIHIGMPFCQHPPLIGRRCFSSRRFRGLVAAETSGTASTLLFRHLLMAGAARSRDVDAWRQNVAEGGQ